MPFFLVNEDPAQLDVDAAVEAAGPDLRTGSGVRGAIAPGAALPKEYWQKKLKRNVERDKEVNDELTDRGWLVLRFWESDIKKDLQKCVDMICEYCGQ